MFFSLTSPRVTTGAGRRVPLLLTGSAGPSGRHVHSRPEIGPPADLATASPSIYNVGMAERAMQEATFLILTALADSSQHGYGIIAEVGQISQGRVRLRAGTLYTALDRLRSEELIGVDREEIVDGRLRRYYRLTPGGGRRLAAEAARLHANATAALRRLGPAPAGGLAL